MEDVRRIADGGAGSPVIWPGGDLRCLAALLEQAELVIGPDTGPVHMAAAVGTATVSLFRATDGARNGPRGERHLQLQSSLDCSPCLVKDCVREAECSGSISVAEVLSAAQKLLQG